MELAAALGLPSQADIITLADHLHWHRRTSESAAGRLRDLRRPGRISESVTRSRGAGDTAPEHVLTSRRGGDHLGALFDYELLPLLSPLYTLIGSLPEDKRDRENVALGQQIATRVRLTSIIPQAYPTTSSLSRALSSPKAFTSSRRASRLSRRLPLPTACSLDSPHHPPAPVRPSMPFI